MINIAIEGNLPGIRTDFTPIMEQSEAIMLASVQMNLTMGGRPQAFKTKGNNATPLVGSGKMYRGVMGTYDSDSATVYMDSGVVSKNGHFYPASLHYGADIPPVEGKLMVFEIDGHTVFTYKRKGFHLGAFPFMIFQDQDIEKITKLYADAIFIENNKRIG